MPHPLYQEYKEQMQRIADLRFSAALLQWDQETYMPAGSAAARARQVATLSETSHQLFVSDKLGSLLHSLHGNPQLTDTEQKNIELSLDDYQKQKKYDSAFVRLLSETCSRAFNHWQEARKKDDFSLFEKDLTDLVALKKQEASLLGYESHPYDALLNEHDRGSNVATLDQVFGGIEEPLKNLLHRILEKEPPDDSFIKKHYTHQAQWDWGLKLLTDIGFDLKTGRQDLSTHPFTVSFATTDVRVTTRVDENDLGNMTWSCLHEGGHALYEQGLPEDQYGLPLGEAASFAVHESQSRLWENCVGRGREYWFFYYPELQKRFAESLNGVGLDDFLCGINRVQPSLIRTEADELTYHFHIIIRYEIEKRLLSGDIQVADIPGFWNEMYKKGMGVVPPNNREGCLQDVHWSHGSFGYFPTYSTGSMMAAQLWERFLKEEAGFASELSAGNTGKLLSWLRKSVHIFGRRFTTNELCSRITGETLNPGYLLKYLEEKYTRIYQLS
jgi:carboxypeptidase Taq